MCGFNAHHQLVHDPDHHDEEIAQLRKVLRSPHLNVRCALWSSTVIQSDGTLLHQGYRPSRLCPTLIDGPPPRNIKSIFGDTSGVLGALATDGSLYLYHDGSHGRAGPEFKKHRFPEDSFIVQQSLAIEYLAIADNGEVCICTSASLSMSAHQPIDFGQTARRGRGIPVDTHPRSQTIHRTFCSPHLQPRSRSNCSHLSTASYAASLQQPLTSFDHRWTLYLLRLQALLP